MCGRLQGQANQKLDCAGLSITKAPINRYLEGRSNLTLNDASEFAKQRMKTAEASSSPDQSTDCNDSTPIHHLLNSSSAPQAKLQGQGRIQRVLQRRKIQPEGRHGGARPQRDYRCSTETTCGYCGLWPHKAGKNTRLWAKSACTAGRVGHFSKVCRQKLYHQQSDKTAVKHIDTEEQPQTTSEWVHNPILHHKQASKSPNKVPQDYSQSPSYPGQGYRAHQTPVGSAV